MTYEQMMLELRNEYLGTLPDRLRDIETHLAEKDYSALYNDFHKLKGSGKTYGIPEISEVGELFEKIGLALQNGQTPRAPADAWIPKAVQLLRAILQARLEKKSYDVGQNADFLEARRLLTTP